MEKDIQWKKMKEMTKNCKQRTCKWKIFNRIDKELGEG